MHVNPTFNAPAKPGLIERIDAWVYRRQQRALERYLATSMNAWHLERRMRDLDHGARSDY